MNSKHCEMRVLSLKQRARQTESQRKHWMMSTQRAKCPKRDTKIRISLLPFSFPWLLSILASFLLQLTFVNSPNNLTLVRISPLGTHSPSSTVWVTFPRTFHLTNGVCPCKHVDPRSWSKTKEISKLMKGTCLFFSVQS